MRTSKTVDGVKYDYYYAGDQLVRMTYGNNILDFYYNANGTPILLNCNGNLFYYITNVQGDVIRLVDIYGQIAAMYQYDPYGNVIQALGSHSQINPLRYRGYYYDNDTGMYYLQSRYYDPQIGRFINTDDISYLGADGTPLSYNLFSYCKNNPIIGYDPTGCWDWEEQAVLGTTILLAGLAILLAAPTGGSSLVLGGLVLSSSTVVAAGGTLVLTGTVMTGTAVAQATVYNAKQSKKSGKERATDKPSWISQSDVDLGKSSQQNATELLNDKYGSGNWRKGPTSEYNRIVKWIDRGLKALVLFMADVLMED